MKLELRYMFYLQCFSYGGGSKEGEKFFRKPIISSERESIFQNYHNRNGWLEQF